VKNENSTQSAVASWRFYLVAVVMVLVGLGVASRVVYLQVVDRDFLQVQGDKRVLRSEKIPAYRGLIQDRNGEPLAVSTPVTTVWANPQKLIESQNQFTLLAKKLGTSESRLRDRVLRNQDKQFIYLRRHMSPHKAAEVLGLKLGGVYGLTEYRRYFPAGEVAAHIVGFVDIDEKGQEGLELAYDDLLQGHPGKKRVVKDLHGRVVKDIGLIKNAEPGENLSLSIDLRAQYIAYKELLTAVKEYKAAAGTIVAVDVDSGEILAMANQPSYNPNNRTRKDVPNFRNRVVTDVFEPGSTVKPFTVAAALESGKWKADSYINTAPGFVKVGSKRIRDMSNYGVIPLTKIITKSSNVGSAKIALSLEPDAVADMFRRVGLGEATGIGFPGESIGIMPFKERWRPIEVATLSYGYGLSVTTLQLAQAYSVIGSGGLKRPLSLLKLDEKNEGQRVLSKEIANQVLEMLETVTEKGGTAKKAKVPGYRVAGKTGTVHKLSQMGYEDHRYLAMFAGIAPVDDPKIALVVVIDDPKGDEYYGGQVAAPVFSRVMSGLLRVKNVPPDRAPQKWVQVNAEPGPNI
jgi:cell division protein FtsI (penicillin-binding protein 3)